MKRILTVSSGKGGVGKTTFAINFALALSTVAPTILVDLDTGTSSVRNCIDAPVGKDLYHFLRKATPLPECVTKLPASLDARGTFKNFGFVAGPRHLIDEITNFGADAKGRMIRAINKLPATFVVLDMKAGLDTNVIDFLPYSNSGILVFTPHLPAATLAASDIVKAILFRKLRILFSPNSPFYKRAGGNPRLPQTINDLLDSVEDVYEEKIHNLDEFLVDLARDFDAGPVVELLRDTIEYFRTYYVLNMFNGVKESYETAIQPFVTNIIENISASINITNLGWIVKSERVHEANCRRVPVLLAPEPVRQTSRPDEARRQVAELEREFLNLRIEKPVQRQIPYAFETIDPSRALDGQLAALRAMFASQGEAGAGENFSYITHRALHLMEAMRPSEFGETKICEREEILSYFFPAEW